MASSPRDENRVPGLIGKSDADGAPVPIEADPVTGRLKVNATITGTSGEVQYTTGDSLAGGTTGTAIIFRTDADIATDVSTSYPLPTRVLNSAGQDMDMNTGNATAQTQRVVLADDQPTVNIQEQGGLIPKIYDTVQITSYNVNNDPLEVVYRTGGAAGTIVATLNITYDGSYNITQVVRT